MKHYKVDSFASGPSGVILQPSKFTGHHQILPFSSSIMNLIKDAFRMASDPKQVKWISPLLIAGDAVLCGLIIWKIPCQ
jgi:hypothetical protein